jgi:CheY-like chemotaxis protein/HPt (histidine-containing phosphotransfer) domain-containing protein
MPRMDGVQLAQAIKADPAVAETRLILLTSVGVRGDAQAAREAGMMAYLTKPIRQSQLYDCLVTALGAPTGPEQETTDETFLTRHTLSEAASAARPLVLIAEDNVVNQKVTARMLEKLGYRVDIVSNGLEAVEAVMRGGYAAVLMDYQMPELDGLDATSEIRRREADGSHIPIIAMTANAMQGDREKCLESGMDDYLAKPVKQETLQAVLSKWVPSQAEGESPRPPRQPAPDEEAIDPKVLAELRRLSTEQEDLLAVLIGHFLEQMPRGLERLRQALAQGDAKRLARIAHELNGSCGNLGARRMCGLCMELQVRGDRGELPGAAPLLERLEAEFERARTRLLAERDRAPDRAQTPKVGSPPLHRR